MSILQDIFGGGANKTAGSPGLGGGLANILNSGAMGDIARNMLTNKQGGISWLKGALVAGAGAMLWKKLAGRVQEENAAANPRYGAVPSAPEEQAARFIRALVYAAKSDGHIDANEQARINAQIRTLNIGKEGEALVQQAMNEPLDPSRIAAGVNDPEEALQLYAVSSAVIDPDQYMEKAYLDGLAQALNIPADVREQVDSQAMAGRT